METKEMSSNETKEHHPPHMKKEFFTIPVISGILIAATISWYIYNPNFCLGFFSGIIFTIIAEVVGVLIFLHIAGAEENISPRINFKLGQMSNIFLHESKASSDPTVDLHSPSFSRDDSNILSEAEDIDSPKLPKLVPLKRMSASMQPQSPQTQSSSSPLNALQGNLRPQRSLYVKRNSFRDLIAKRSGSIKSSSEKEKFVSIGRKAYVGSIDYLINLFRGGIYSEARYGRALINLNGPQSQTSVDHSCEISITNLSTEQLGFLMTNYGIVFNDKEGMLLPTWMRLREVFKYLGGMHVSFATALEKTTAGRVEMLKSGYEAAYSSIKNEKCLAKDMYREASLAYKKAVEEHEDLKNDLEAATTEYKTQMEQKVKGEILLKLEMKAKKLQLQLDSARNKLSINEDKLSEALKAVELENERIAKFIITWEVRRVEICQEMFSGYLSGLVDYLESSDKDFAKLIKTIESSEFDKSEILQTAISNVTVSSLSSSENKENLDDLSESDSNCSGLNMTTEKCKEKKRTRFMRALRSTFNTSEKAKSKVVLKESYSIKDNVNESSVIEIRNKLDDYEKYYEDELRKLDVEIQTVKEAHRMVKQLEESMETLIKEKKKLKTIDSSIAGQGILKNYKDIFYGLLNLRMTCNIKLADKLAIIERSFHDLLDSFESQAESCKDSLQDSYKKVDKFIKSFERELQGPSFRGAVKSLIRGPLTENDTNILLASLKSVGKPRISGSSLNTSLSSNKELMESKESIFRDLEAGVTKVQQTVQRLRERIPAVKKDILIAYLESYNAHRGIMTTFANQAAKVNNLAEEEKKRLSEVPIAPNEGNVESQPTQIKPGRITKMSTMGKLSQRSNTFTDLTNLQIENIPPEQTPLKLDGTVDENFGSTPLARNIKKKSEHSMHTFEKGKHVVWLNRIMTVLFGEWASSPIFKFKVQEGLRKTLNKRPKKYIKSIEVLDASVESKAPHIKSIDMLESESNEFMCDFDLAYSGSVLVTVEARIEPHKIIGVTKDYFIPVRIKIVLRRFHGKVRVCFRPSGKESWFCFIGEPMLDLNIEPLFGNKFLSANIYPRVESAIRGILTKKLRKMTYPNKETIHVPLTKDD